MKKIQLFILCIYFPSLVFAQKSPVKFGKIDESLVRMITHPIDTSADAIVLMNYGETIFKYDNNNRRFYYEFERIIRIKILSKEGLKYGDFKIPFYHYGSASENILALKGYSYNWQSDKLVKSKLEKSSIYEEKLDDNWDEMKISMPDVTVGTVVEITYKITSPYKWNLQTWNFQSYIPVVHSEYKITIPEYFDYQLLESGYINLSINTKETGSSSVTLNTKTSNDTGKFTMGNMPKTANKYSSQQIVFKTTKYRWVATNVPAYKQESFVASPSDYISRIEFALRGTQYPNSAYEEYMGTWQSLNRTFLEHSQFGDAIKLTGYMNKELDVISNLSSDMKKIAALVNLVKKQIEWNGQYRIYVTNTLRSSWTSNKGSTAEINLIIVAGLKKLGFEADPVLISTRGNGTIRDEYAISNQFNSVIVWVKLGEGELLLDGTDNYLPVNVLPKSCLNGKGWKVSKASSRWIKIEPLVKQERIVQATFNIDPDGLLVGNVEISSKGYAGYTLHKELKLKGEEDFFEEFQQKNTEWLIDEYKYNTEANYHEPFKSNYKVELNEELIVAGERIYLNPTINEVMNESPFKLNNRKYPVDFAYPIRSAYMFNFIIPEGYKIEDAPKPTAFAMPNRDAIFQYSISIMGNELHVVVDLKINKTRFTQVEYPVLKQFYHQVVQKCEEQVVIKKNS